MLLLTACNDYRLQEEPAPGAPSILVEADHLDGGICPGTTLSAAVRNLGDAALTVHDVRFVAEGWEVAPYRHDFVLGPGEAHRFRAVGDGGEGSLTVTSDDPARPVVTVPFGGPANEPPRVLILSPVDEASLPVEGDVLLEALVDDADTPLDTLSLAWVSSVTGVVAEPTPDPYGRVQTTWPAEARAPGPQWMDLVVSDDCGPPVSDLAWFCQDGPYVVRPLEEEGWRYDGVARQESDVLFLTEGASEIGGAFDLSSVFDADLVRVSFEVYTGLGEGFALTLLDAERREGFLGGDGCGLGFGGGRACTAGPALPGWSLAFDLVPDGEECLGVPYVALHRDGDLTAPQACAALPALGEPAWHLVEVRAEAGALTVSWDGAPLVDAAVDGLDFFQGYVGLTATTGAAGGDQRVRNLVVTDERCEM